MEITGQDTTLSRNATKRLKNEDSKFSQFKMVDGVQPVHRLSRPSTNMANRLLVSRMVRVDHGPIRFITSPVRTSFYKSSVKSVRSGIVHMQKGNNRYRFSQA